MTTRPADRELRSHADPPAQADPRAVRVTLVPASRAETDRPITVGPPSVAVEPPRGRLAGVGVLGGLPGDPSSDPAAAPPSGPPSDEARIGLSGPPSGTPRAAALPLVDGRATDVRLEWLDDERAVLVRPDGDRVLRTRVVIGPVLTRTADGAAVREIVVDGWRFDVEIESERRAALRERARRGREAVGHSGPLEVHAIIPGRIVAVSVVPGEAIAAGQQLLVLEAMKMQNELRAPREGTIERVAVSVGVNVEVGDLLMVIS